MNFLEGTIKQYLFYNEESSYSVIRVEIKDTAENELIHFEPTIVVCGFFPRLEQYQTYKFYGEVTNHPKYGIQYSASRFERIMESTRTGIIDYLSSDLFKGIGPKTAEAIVDSLGLDALNKIANNRNVLDEIPRMNQQKKDLIAETLHDNRQMESTLVWLYGFEISPRMAMKIYQKYGYETIDIIKSDPYVLIDEVEGIGFKRADEIGLKIGFAYNHPLRLKAVIMYLLSEYMNKYGDTYLEKDKLLEYTMSYLNVNEDFYIEESQVIDRLELLSIEGKIIDVDEKISLRGIYFSEKAVASILYKHSQYEDEPIDDTLIEDYLNQLEKIRNIAYTTMQRKAIIKALKEHLVIITGGPGTGKTTIIDAITHVYRLIHQANKSIASKIKLVAPTGKAAKRLIEATGLEATTIHRLLGYDYEGHFAYSQHEKIDASLIIIDETSMMDISLANHLFQALSPRTKLVIVGDENQLPSVGPGQVLCDLIESDLFTVVKLEKIHRQAIDSSIISLAYDVLSQNLNEHMFEQKDDRMFIQTRENMVSDYILKSIRNQIHLGYSLLEDIQVLIPIYKGMNGIDRINQLIQERFNRVNEAFQIAYKDKTFRFQDKVMQLVNQPEDGIMNGDLGVVTGIIEDKEILVDFSGRSVKYNVKDFDNITLAYAISIHKSQGSEFKVVILPLVRSYTIMLKRKLIYTAITRAKETLIMIGEKEALQRGIYGKEPPRKTWMKQFLQEIETTPEDKFLTIEDFL